METTPEFTLSPLELNQPIMSARSARSTWRPTADCQEAPPSVSNNLDAEDMRTYSVYDRLNKIRTTRSVNEERMSRKGHVVPA